MKISNGIVAALVGISVLPFASIAQPMMPSDMAPPNARPGQCFARVLVPATYVADQALNVAIEDGYVMPRVADAKFSQPVARDVIASDGYKTFQVTNPEFGYVDEKIVLVPAHHKVVVTPPMAHQGFKTYVVKKPTLVWRRGSDLSNVRRINGATGETYCLVEEYGETVNVPYTSYSAPKADVKFVPVAEQSIVNRRQIVTKEASVREVYVPPVLNAKNPRVNTQELISDAQIIGEDRIAPRTTTINTQRLDKPEYYTWVEVPCDNSNVQKVSVDLSSNQRVTNSNVAPSDVVSAKKPLNAVTAANVQKRLGELGFYRGPVDNIYGSKTRDAMRRFQESKGLNADGKPSIEALKALGF